jgi:hypothetical protein
MRQIVSATVTAVQSADSVALTKLGYDLDFVFDDPEAGARSTTQAMYEDKRLYRHDDVEAAFQRNGAKGWATISSSVGMRYVFEARLCPERVNRGHLENPERCERHVSRRLDGWVRRPHPGAPPPLRTL